LQNSNLHTAPVGGDKDAHGCILGAGYSWDATLNKCVRPWEKLSVLFDNKEWYLVDKTGAVRTDVSLRVNNGTISGKVCNVYSGSVAIHDADSTITVSRVVSTLMACTNNSLTQIETSLHKLLNGTIKVDLNADNGHITLTGNGEKLDFSQMYQQ
jgi:heat shock protein HslJ